MRSVETAGTMPPGERLAKWMMVNLLLGAMPMLITYCVYVLSAHRTAQARVEDLMFMVITLVGTTFIESSGDSVNHGPFQPVFHGILTVLLIFAGLFLGITAFSGHELSSPSYLDLPLLLRWSFALVISAALTTLGIEIRVCYTRIRGPQQ